MNILLKDNVVILSSIDSIEIDTDRDCFLTSLYHVYDPAPSSGVVVQEMDFPEESFNEYSLIDGVPVLIRPRKVAPPNQVTAFQAKAALLNSGLLALVNDCIAESTPLEQLAWSDAVVFNRDSPLLAALAARLSLSNDQVDDLFIQAALITV